MDHSCYKLFKPITIVSRLYSYYLWQFPTCKFQIISECLTYASYQLRKMSKNIHFLSVTCCLFFTDEWKRPDGVTTNFNSIKLEVRRHNSLTLVGGFEKTSGINPERAAVSSSSLLRKGRQDDNGDRHVDESQRIDDSSHKDENLVVSHSTAQQGNQMLFYDADAD